MMPVLLCVVAVCLLLLCEKKGIERAEWLFKPLAAAAFIWAGLAWGGLDGNFGPWLVLGLVLCMAGDVLLIPKGQGPAFMAGMLAFLLGHLAYAIAFLQLGVLVFRFAVADSGIGRHGLVFLLFRSHYVHRYCPRRLHPLRT